jgi:regulator of protease activity HflC (stomatin/prohibitin superfamily)
MDTTVIACLVGSVGIFGLAIVAFAVRVIQEYERIVVFRVGRCVGARGPGLVLLLPFVERGVKVDLREQVRDIPHQTSITKDNVTIAIDFIWYYKVVDAVMSVIKVGNFEIAAEGMATTTLRSVIGAILLDDVLSEREHINQTIRVKLDEVTERWGVKVTNVEIREIIPPDDIQDAMTRQMTAERIRRATVTESTGLAEAAINIADGEKQAAILIAEGDKQSNILRAEGDREAQLLRAEGYSAGLQRIHDIAKDVDENTMTLQYFDALKEMGASPSTKYIFPMEFARFLEGFRPGK